MKPARLSLVLLVLLLALVATISRANEDTKINPYESIAARNPFQLRDPPPQPNPEDFAKPPPAPLATVEVTGVMNMLSKKMVLLEIVPGPGKPPLKPTLQEGERVEAVEVLFIDVENGEVKINNGGTITNIALKTPPKQPTGPAGPLPGVQPGFPPQVLAPNTSAGVVRPTIDPTTGLPNSSPYNRGNVMVVGGAPAQATPTAPSPIAKPYYGTGAAPAGGVPTYGATPYNAASGVNVTGGAAGAPGGSGVNVTGGNEFPTRQIPTRPVRTQPQALTSDPAAQYLNMAIQKQQLESRGVRMPPLPPIPGFDPEH